MKYIGIVAGAKPEQATALKAALIAKDPLVKVVIEETAMRQDAPDERVKLADLKIELFNAVEALAAKGVRIAAFTCACPHAWFDELAASRMAVGEALTNIAAADVKLPEVKLSLNWMAACGAKGEPLPVEDYAEKLLSTCDALPVKPYKVGLIGGLGPAATVDLYDKIVKATPATTDQEHIRLVVEQNPQIPDRTKALLEVGADPTLALYRCAKALQADGCDAVIIPCNTAHAFMPYMRRHLDVNFIDMQESCLNEIQAKFGDKARVGLMATTGTVRTGIYSKKAEAMGIPMFVPDEAHQARVMAAIYGPKGAKAGFTDGNCREDLVSAAEYLVKTYDCNVLILGCTELPLILDEGDFDCVGKTVYIIDPTSSLARRVVKTALAANKERGF